MTYPRQSVAPDGDPVADVVGLSASTNEKALVRGVDLRIMPGEIVAVVGRSGAGKSVLSRSLLGLASGGVGHVEVAAELLRIGGVEVLTQGVARNSRARRRLWRRLRTHVIGYVPQDALGSLDPLVPIGVTIGETLRVQGVPEVRRRERVAEAMRAASLDPELIDSLPHQLSGGMRQRALIAAAIAHEPQLLIADEPTSALDSTTAREVMETFRAIAQKGTGILIVSHDLISVQHVADRVVVIDDGELVEARPVTELLGNPRHEATRLLVRAARAEPVREPSIASSDWEAAAVEATGVSRHYSHSSREVRAVNDVSLRVTTGSRWGVVGESGSGKSTLIRLLLALEQPDSGQVTLFDRPWSALRERERRARRHEAAYVPQDVSGSFNPRTRIGRILRQAGARDHTEIAQALTAVALPPQLASERVGVLSGGMRQRLAIARALVTGARMLICDEPFSALDAITLRDMLELLDALATERDLTLILVTHDLAVVRSLCDSVAVMSGGDVVESGHIEQIWERPANPATRRLLEAARL